MEILKSAAATHNRNTRQRQESRKASLAGRYGTSSAFPECINSRVRTRRVSLYARRSINSPGADTAREPVRSLAKDGIFPRIYITTRGGCTIDGLPFLLGDCTLRSVESAEYGTKTKA